MGGIRTGLDALEFVLAGANAVSIGTVVFHDPSAPVRIHDELPRALAERGFSSSARRRRRTPTVPRRSRPRRLGDEPATSVRGVSRPTMQPMRAWPIGSARRPIAVALDAPTSPLRAGCASPATRRRRSRWGWRSSAATARRPSRRLATPRGRRAWRHRRLPRPQAARHPGHRAPARALAVAHLEPAYLTVHASGGAAMVAAAVEALPGTRITAVTVLTSLSCRRPGRDRAGRPAPRPRPCGWPGWPSAPVRGRSSARRRRSPPSGPPCPGHPR